MRVIDCGDLKIYRDDSEERMTTAEMDVDNFFEAMKEFYLQENRHMKQLLRRVAIKLANDLREPEFIAMANAIKEVPDREA